MSAASNTSARKRWKSDEDRLLRNRYNHVPREELAGILGRTTDSVTSRAQRLGLCQPKEDYWSAEHVALLKSGYKTMSIDELQRMLARSADQIWMKAFKLGLRRGPRSRDSNRVVAKFLATGAGHKVNAQLSHELLKHTDLLDAKRQQLRLLKTVRQQQGDRQ